MNHRLIFLLLFAAQADVLADPQLSSWFTADSGQYARIYQTTAAETAGTKSTTWSRGTGIQSNPTYATVSEVSYSASWVYIRTTGLASHMMGPWYLDAAKTQNFPNFPSNTAVIYRIPRVPVIPASKTLTGLGTTGRMVNGVSMFDSRDAFSYSNSNATDATPTNGITGDGIWNRDAYTNESVTFDAAYAHQAGNNYHYHAQPIALRYQLGDHVDYNATTNRYTENASAVTKHSPIVAWAADGIPVYGPYGYSSPMDPNSGVRRMICGFVKRDGNNGTTNLSSTGRTTLPAWAARVQSRSTTLSSGQYGPVVNATYTLGHYIEDYDYLGDLGYAQGVDFDLNEQNVRYCVTPEYPSGTWAYFLPIAADGTPMYPYTTGRQYYGTPSGGAVTSITETVTTHFSGGPNKTDVLNQPVINGGDVTLSWSGIEGGSYTVQASPNLADWTSLTPDITAIGDDSVQVTESGVGGNTTRFYKIARASTLATFDSNGFNYTQSGGGGGGGAVNVPGGTATRGTTVVATITLPTSPPQPPANLVPISVVIGGSISGTSISRPSQGTVVATFTIPAGAATGAQNVVVTFNPGPTYTLTGGITIQ
ncbi:YHYH protein [Prosthecobacter sp.]|uniref:YHYH protein n=1 Tax=Prosthecobacter sp. TaxID=1965333 RepID=UPI001DF3295F|nr:YHYH protein [Prosthecobacter sp.]MCB1278628.1 YHYH protein [Prosthecobacter sp.]